MQDIHQTLPHYPDADMHGMYPPWHDCGSLPSNPTEYIYRFIRTVKYLREEAEHTIEHTTAPYYRTILLNHTGIEHRTQW